MNINVTATKVSIDNESLNKGEYNIRECNFELTEEFTGLVCKALFTISKTKLTYEQSIVNGKCNIPYEATLNRGKVIIGVIGYEIEDEELIKRYSPEPDEFFVLDGSYVEDIENQAVPTPSDLEQLEQRVSAIEIDAEQVEINTQNISDLQENKADKTELEDFVTKDANDLTYYTLTTQTGSQIELTLNSTNFKMIATLKDKNGNVVNTSNEIDLPLESVVINASYDSTTKELVLTLQNGTTVRVSIADLVSGLVSDTDYATSSKGGVIKVANSKGTSISNGVLTAATVTYENYGNLNGNGFISKGTLDNVITGKQLVNETQLNTKADKSALVTGTGENITLSNTAELEFIQPPLPRGNSEQVQYSGKQLLPFTNQDVTLGGVTFKAINGRLILNGTATENINGSYFINNYFKVHLTQGNYILSRTNVNSNLTIMFLSSNVDVIGRLSRDSSDLTNSFTISAENDYYIGFYISSGVSFNNYDSGVMVSTTGGAYEPYVGGTASPNPSYPQAITNVTGDVEVVVQNKNLFDKDNQYANNYYDDNGNEVTSTNSGHFVNKIKVKPNTQYTMSGFLIGSGLSNFTRIYFYDGNGNWISRSAVISTVPNTFTTPSNCEYINFQLNNNPSYPLYSASIDTFMLEEGTTATPYTPHKEQTYTFPLGTQRMFLGDYLADDGIHHVRGRLDLSTLSWNTYKTNGYEASAPSNLKKPSSQTEVANILAEKYIARQQSGTIPNGYIAVSQNKTFLCVDETGTPTGTVEYELATEEITPYTTEQQTAYDEIKQALSYEEQTNISGSSDESNPLFSVQAVQYKEPDYWTIAYVNAQIGNAIGGAY